MSRIRDGVETSCGVIATVRVDLEYLDERLNGSISLDVMIDTGKKDGVKQLDFLQSLELSINEVEHQKIAGIVICSTFSILDILKETHQALNANEQSFYQLADNQPLIAQEILLFESSGGDDLEKITDQDFRHTRVTIKTPYTDSVLFEPALQQIRYIFDKNLGEYAIINITGDQALQVDAIPKALRSMVNSYIIAAIVITFLLMFMAGNWKLGLFCMIPNVLPILVLLGTMGYFSIPIDLTSIMIGSIALGVVVDDTLHFIYNYTKYLSKNGDSEAAVKRTLNEVGRAMLMTTAIVVLGFSVDVTASMSNVVAFGLMISLVVLLALTADLLVSPSMMILI